MIAQNGMIPMKIFDTTYPLSITKNYVSRWGVNHAIRELIQNAIDSESPFKYEFTQDSLSLTSEFTTLSPQTLLLGSTSKADNGDMIGSFGEGYKIALLVLTRLGHAVEIRNGNKLWTPTFEHSKIFNEEILVVRETSLSDRSNIGLTIVVRGLDQFLKDAIIESCLLMQNNVGEIKSTQYGDILLERPGKLYVGGLYICDVDTEYGYSIHPKHIRLERDRQTVYSWDLEQITTNMWYETGDIDRIVKMIADGLKDVSYAQYNSPQIVKEACYEFFRKEHPGALIASSATEMKAMIEKGMTKTVYVGGYTHAVVSSYSGYQEDSKRAMIIAASPHDRMKTWLSDNRSEMRAKAIVAFKQILEESANWRLK